MKRLTQDNFEEYLYDVYSAWLGKIIGIRLGAPVENWDYRKIRDTYKGKHGYLTDYGIFASDDDSNGPLFFVRALEGKKEMTAEDVGNAILNYLQEYKGFFWWGGTGVSSEHTAYENLKKGLKGSECGSYLTNGKTIAEQIGGQIFSDCWGYVSGYDPETAKDLAAKASSVTHDLSGIQGGIFVAVAITLAMQIKDVHEVLDRALEYLDPESEYCKVAKDIISFRREGKGSFEDCHKYILDNYGYDKYPGVCHIIPNTALMIMAMEYGDGDFDATLESLNNCGWDTDCNCGNVGSIMGALVGVKKINPKWITPVNDIVNASSCMGSLNIQTVSDSARYFAKLAYRYKGIPYRYLRRFELPYETSGFFKVEGRLYKYVYYLGKDVYDARYEPEYSPIVYPGDEIVFTVEGKGDVSVFVKDCEGREYTGKNRTVKGIKYISYRLPQGDNLVINIIGLKYEGDITLRNYDVVHHPKIEYSFKDLPDDSYSPIYEGKGIKTNLRAFVFQKGSYTRCKEGIKVKGCLASSGHLEDRYENISLELSDMEGSAYLVFGMKGALYHKKFGVRENRLIFIEKGIEERTVFESEPLNEEIHELSISTYASKTEFYCNGKMVYECEGNLLSSLYGFACDEDSSFTVRHLSVN